MPCKGFKVLNPIENSDTSTMNDGKNTIKKGTYATRKTPGRSLIKSLIRVSTIIACAGKIADKLEGKPRSFIHHIVGADRIAACKHLELFHSIGKLCDFGVNAAGASHAVRIR